MTRLRSTGGRPQHLAYVIAVPLALLLRRACVRADLEYALSTQYKPGETVPVTVVRDGREQTVQVRLGDRPTAQPR